MTKGSLVLGAVTAVLLTAPFANTASAADFRLCNHSPHHIVEFKVEAQRDRGDYSQNWLRQPLAEGSCVPLSFAHNQHVCHIRHLIRLRNGEIHKGEVDICRVRKLEYHRDGHVSWE